MLRIDKGKEVRKGYGRQISIKGLLSLFGWIAHFLSSSSLSLSSSISYPLPPLSLSAKNYSKNFHLLSSISAFPLKISLTVNRCMNLLPLYSEASYFQLSTMLCTFGTSRKVTANQRVGIFFDVYLN